MYRDTPWFKTAMAAALGLLLPACSSETGAGNPPGEASGPSRDPVVASGDTATAWFGADSTGKPLAVPRWVVRSGSLVPGTTDTVAIVFAIEPGWHMYWRGRNDSGLYPDVRLTLPQGFEAGEILWPAPHRKISPGNILDHVYTGHAVLVLPVRVPLSAAPGSRVTFEASMDWMVCRGACIPESGTLSAALPVGPAPESHPSTPDAAVLTDALARLPRPLPSELGLHMEWRDRVLDIRLDEAEALAFYPGTACSNLADPIRDAASESGRLALEFAKSKDPEIRVRGVLEVRFAGRIGPSRFYQLALTGPASG